ncbi:MAG TPA: SusC/RagA family TonB-linked outer membrane protein, partial [Hymenobacter sp.]|nr:SusC/RagA family TonB-linked outer membrane protein [Hymenobacter sp.]
VPRRWPAAASIYGSQAANGVVLVTTKRGKAGRTQISLNYYTGIDEPVKRLDVLNTQEWIALRTQARINGGQTSEAARTTVLGTIRQPATLTDAEIAALPTYDWQKEAYRNGNTNNYELSMNGGSERTKFFVSGSYYTQNANLINVDFKRGTLNTTLTQTINPKLTLDQTLKLSTITARGQQGSPNGGSFLGSSAFSSSLMLPSVPIYNPDGSFYGTPDQGGTPGILNQNIIQVSSLNDIKTVINQFNGGLALNYKPFAGFILRPFVSIDYRAIKGRYFTDPRTADAFVVRGRLQDQFNQNINFLTNLTANYARTFAQKHDMSLLLGLEYRSDINEATSAQTTNVPTPDFRYGNAGALPVAVGGGWTGYRKGSVFGNLKYNFNKKYDLSLIARLDGSSRFGANNRFGFFPSASAAWLISEEDFLKGSSIVSELKFRASYGTTGNDQIGTLFGLANFPSLGLVSAGFDYNGSAGFAPTQLGNPDLKWETNVTTNLGLDFGLLSNRITGSVDVFDRTSRDLLLAANLPFTNGFSSISRNAGSVQNRGLEIELNTVNVRSGNFQWKSSFNITFIDNKVIKLIDGIKPLANPDSAITLNYTDYYGVGRTAIVGRPLLPNYTTEYAGANPATGRPMFYDYAGNITYTPITPRDQRYLGSQQPKFYGGFLNTITYAGLSLDVFFQYDYGRRSFNSQTSFLSELAGREFNALRSVYERRWQKPGDITDVPRPINGNTETRGISSLSGSRTLEDASYLRLKQLRLNYSIPT